MLTRREREVAALIARGLTNKEIAAQLVIAQRTAESHVENILVKLGFASRSQIAVWAAQQSAAVPPPVAGGAQGSAGFAGVDLAATDAMRRTLELHLSGPGVVSPELDDLELAVDTHGRRYGSIPELLAEFTADMHRIQTLLTLRLTDEQRKRAYRLVARLGTMLGASFCYGGRRDDGWQWLCTSERFAELAGDADSESWSLSIRARLSLLYNEFSQARALARRALSLPGCSPGARLWSWDTQAQGLAAAGRTADSMAVLDKVIKGREQRKFQLPDGVFGYPERQLLRAVSGVHAVGGDSREATSIIDTARSEFPSGYVQTLLSLDEVTALIRQGEIDHACVVAASAWQEVPANQRGPFKNKFAWTLGQVPVRQQNLTCVKTLRTLATQPQLSPPR